MKWLFRTPSFEAFYATAICCCVLFLLGFGLYMAGIKMLFAFLGIAALIGVLIVLANVLDRYVFSGKRS